MSQMIVYVGGRHNQQPKLLTAQRIPNNRLKSNYGLFNHSNIRIRFWSWNYRAAGTRLALQWFSAVSIRYNPLQALKDKAFRNAIFRCCLANVLALGNLRTCC